MICNHGVAGSSPAAGTNQFKHLAQPLKVGLFVFRLVACQVQSNRAFPSTHTPHPKRHRLPRAIRKPDFYTSFTPRTQVFTKSLGLLR